MAERMSSKRPASQENPSVPPAARPRLDEDVESSADRLKRLFSEATRSTTTYGSIAALITSLGAYTAALLLSRSTPYRSISRTTVTFSFLTAVRDRQHYITDVIFEGLALSKEVSMKLLASSVAVQSGFTTIVRSGDEYLFLPPFQTTSTMVFIAPSTTITKPTVTNVDTMCAAFLNSLPDQLYATQPYRDPFIALMSYLSSLKKGVELPFDWYHVFSGDFQTAIGNAGTSLMSDGLRSGDKLLLSSFLGPALASQSVEEVVEGIKSFPVEIASSLYLKSNHCLPLPPALKHYLSDRQANQKLTVKAISDLSDEDLVVLSDTKPSYEMLTNLTVQTMVQIVLPGKMVFEVGGPKKDKFFEKKSLTTATGACMRTLAALLQAGQASSKAPSAATVDATLPHEVLIVNL